MKYLLWLTAFSALSLASAPALAADAPSAGVKHFEVCAKICADCQLQCDTCFKVCLALLGEGKKEHAKSARLCADCAECCKLCSTLCGRNSPFCQAACECCAKCCDDCAAECEMSVDTPELRAVVDICKKCASSCRETIKKVARR